MGFTLSWVRFGLLPVFAVSNNSHPECRPHWAFYRKSAPNTVSLGEEIHWRLYNYFGFVVVVVVTAVVVVVVNNELLRIYHSN